MKGFMHWRPRRRPDRGLVFKKHGPCRRRSSADRRWPDTLKGVL